MGLSPLGPRNIRRMERDTGFDIAWGSLACHHHEDIKGAGQWFRFWRKTTAGVNLGYYNTKTRDYYLTGATRDHCQTSQCQGYALAHWSPECDECRVARVRKEKE